MERNRKPVPDARALRRMLEEAPRGEPILLKVEHGGHTRFVAIERP